MDEVKRKQLEAAGFVVGDFEQFATEVLGMSVPEAREVQFRADLGVAISRLRRSLKLTRPAFGKLVGLAQAELARLEIAAPEISLDLMLKVYFAAGGQISYAFNPSITHPSLEPKVFVTAPNVYSPPPGDGPKKRGRSARSVKA